MPAPDVGEFVLVASDSGIMARMPRQAGVYVADTGDAQAAIQNAVPWSLSGL